MRLPFVLFGLCYGSRQQGWATAAVTLGSLSAGCEPHILGSVSRMQRKTRACKTASAVAHLVQMPQMWLDHKKGKMVCWKTCGARGLVLLNQIER